MNINCMPCNWLENMPEVMRRQMFPIDCANTNGQISDGQSMLPFNSLNTSGTSTLSRAALYQAMVDSMSSNPDSKRANKLLKMPEGAGKHSVHLNSSLTREFWYRFDNSNKNKI